MTFAADIRQWKTIAEFRAHLAAHDPAIASWADGIIIHHTYRPLQSQWNGRQTMEGLKRFYIDKGWDAGPHLFIAQNSPNPADNGIWQLTPLNMVGIHAGVCNAHNWGIEVVGDYDVEVWSTETREFAVGAAAALAEWRSISINAKTLKGHRDCNSPKTCPGKAINMEQVRLWVTMAMSGSVPQPETITAYSNIIAAPRCTPEQAYTYIVNRKPVPSYTAGDFKLSILPAYWKLAEQTGVDPCLAIAQTIHETANFSSWWAQRPRRNPAGIGVTGEKSATQPVPEEFNKWAWNEDTRMWHKGLVFASWQIGILSQMGRLAAYAVKPTERTAAQKVIVDQALMMRSLPLSLQGTAPQLIGLNGKWAYPGTTYAQAIAAIAQDMAQTTV